MPIMTFIEPIPKDCVLCPDDTPATHFVVNVSFFGGGKAGCYCKKHAQKILNPEKAV